MVASHESNSHHQSTTQSIIATTSRTSSLFSNATFPVIHLHFPIMYIKTITSVAFAATLALGGPVFPRGTWKNPKGGNLDINLSDKQVNWGSANPADVIQKLLDHCHADGTCDSEFEVDSSWTTDNGNNPLEKGSVKISITDAQFEVWAKNGLVAAMKAVVKKASKVDHTSWTVAPACGGNICTTGGGDNDIDQWTGPEQINLQVRDADGGLKDFLHITASPHVYVYPVVLSMFTFSAANSLI